MEISSLYFFVFAVFIRQFQRTKSLYILVLFDVRFLKLDYGKLESNYRTLEFDYRTL
jgi:hypothetical protein